MEIRRDWGKIISANPHPLTPMLPSDLLSHRMNGETIVPKRLEINPKNLAIASQLITCFQEAVGCP
ncbi:MAG: DUF790 family protein, partial [Planktothrix sp.]